MGAKKKTSTTVYPPRQDAATNWKEEMNLPHTEETAKHNQVSAVLTTVETGKKLEKIVR